jgi:hypothetical protein
MDRKRRREAQFIRFDFGTVLHLLRNAWQGEYFARGTKHYAQLKGNKKIS